MAEPHSKARINIAGLAVDVTYEEVPLNTLSLDPENPRIRLQRKFSGRKRASTQAELMDLMRAQTGYDPLHKQIRTDGGLSDPLMVRYDGRIVEGNTRFTVMSVLFKTPGGAEKWANAPIIRLPKNVPEKVIQLQMAGFHVSGKTKWRAAAKADQIYNLIEISKATLEEVAAVTRMTAKEVQYNIDAYKFLVEEVIPELEAASAEDKQIILDRKFSHALEFVKKPKLKAVREDPEARKGVAKRIADGTLKGQDVRNLDRVFANPRAREALEKKGVVEAKEVLRKADPTGDSKLLMAVAKVSASLEDLDHKDLDLFQTEAKARATLQRLIDAAGNLLAMASVKGKPRA